MEIICYKFEKRYNSTKQPAADVVKVVRCKDCKYSREPQTKLEKAMYCSDCVICTNGEICDTEFAMWDDGFCSYGERKDEKTCTATK